MAKSKAIEVLQIFDAECQKDLHVYFYADVDNNITCTFGGSPVHLTQEQVVRILCKMKELNQCV